MPISASIWSGVHVDRAAAPRGPGIRRRGRAAAAPPASSSVSCVARATPSAVRSGSTPRPKRRDASVDRLSAADATPDTGPVPAGAFEDDLAGGVGDLAVLAAHDAGQAARALLIGDDHHARRRAGAPRRPACAGARRRSRGARRSSTSRKRCAIERVQRLADFEHDVVGHVDDVADRPHAGEVQTALQPVRRRSNLDAAHDRRGEPRTADGVFDPNRQQLARRRRAGRARRPSPSPGRAAAASPACRARRTARAPRAQRPSSTCNRADWGDVDVEDGLVRDTRPRAGRPARRARRCRCRLCRARCRSSSPGAHHAFGGDAAELAAADLADRESAAGRDVRDDVADVQIGRAGDHRRPRPSAQVDPRHVQRFPPRMLFQLDDPADGDVLPVRLPTWWTSSTSSPAIVSRCRSSAAARRSRPARAASSAAPSCELLQEAQVVGVEQADVVDAVLDHARCARCPCPRRSRCTARGRSRRAAGRADGPCPRPGSPASRCRGRSGSRNRCRHSDNTKWRSRRPARRTGSSRTGSACACCAPNMRCAKVVSVPRRSARVMPSSTARPSIWWNIHSWVASVCSAR